MELYNKSKRSFTVIGLKDAVKPEKAFKVSDEEGKKLLNLYKGEIIKVSDNKEEVNEIQVKLDEALAKIKELKQDIKDLQVKHKAKIKELESIKIADNKEVKEKSIDQMNKEELIVKAKSLGLNEFNESIKNDDIKFAIKEELKKQAE